MKREFEVICKNCGKKFTVFEEETKFPIKGDKYFCCRSCANTRHHSEETKQKISKGIKLSEKYNNSVKVKHELYMDKISKLKQNIYNKCGRYYCGSKELDEQNTDISCRQSPKYFKKLIPFGLDITTLYTKDFIKEYTKVKQLLYDEYVNNCLSPAEIYHKYNCKEYFNHSETLLHLFKDWKFPIRGWSKSCINSWLNGKLTNIGKENQYKQQWHTTWNGKEVYLQ